ncbi:HlyD family efflux transporter periplasmic adaptor subunit [Salinispirillum marinum]|uniref:HlyD family efflux transporter periplasmic adaptor subunit n=2 Tax=Saccharospirillaceae TaxID=255527 RepID=A0ABV8BGX7_9GAMM
MTTALFRQQAMERQRDRLWGEVLLIQPLSLRLLTGIVVLIVASILTYLFWGTYARKETVQGHLVPSSGVIRVYAARPGVIRQVLTQEGDVVQAGQPLFVINGDSILADGRHLEQVLLDEYEYKQSLLQQELERIPAVFQRRHTDLVREASAINTDVQWLNQQKSTLQQRLAIVDNQLNNMQRLHEMRMASEVDVQAILADRLAILSELQGLERSISSQTHQHDLLANRAAQLNDDQSAQQHQLQAELSTLAQQIAELYGRKAYVITAERSGTVTTVQATEGQDAGQGIPLATLLPEDSTLVAELLVPTRAIGFIEPGQALNIRYAAFPYQKFGLYQGEISQVSDHVLLPNEWLQAPIAVEEPLYRVIATLHQQGVIAFGQETPLRPGILLDADITLGQRTLVQWLLEPLYSLKGRLQ